MSDVALTSLVIDSRKLARMGMDGPALKVTMRGRSAILFPLRRLCRIHILGTPESGMDALLFCAEQRVPVAFFHFNGRLRCRLHSSGGAPALLLLYALATRVQQQAAFRVTAQSMTEFYQRQAMELEFFSRRMLTQLVIKLESVV